MKTFMGNNFLLSNDTAKVLYHNYAAKMPIIDYHCHVNPKEIAENRKYNNITEIWLGGDHYKWRAIRSNGIEEEYITGNASDFDKFKAYAKTMPKLIGNPLYHWSHLELKRYFGYNGILNEDTCEAVWNLCNDRLSEDCMSVRNIIKNSGVELICTTDDPIDNLDYHKTIAEDNTFSVKVLPTFRPDKGMNIERVGFADYIKKLQSVSRIKIVDLTSLKRAYTKRLDIFNELGCLTADHGFDDYVVYKMPENESQADDIFKKALASNGSDINLDEMKIYKTEMMRFFGSEYTKRNWAMQIHFGVLRNANKNMFDKIGPDTGFDTIGGTNCITDLSNLLDLLNTNNSLPRTILYSINPADNEALGTLIGTFPSLQHGSAWWFNDNIVGMKKQITELASLSPFGNFIGMLTDSRSFISYTRHEYFRRILCDIIGTWVENGEYPCDINTLAQLVCDICYNNTKNFFKFNL